MEEPVVPPAKRRKLKKDDDIPISITPHESNLVEAENPVFINKEEKQDSSLTNKSNSSSTDEGNSSTTDDGQSDPQTAIKKDDEDITKRIEELATSLPSMPESDSDEVNSEKNKEQEKIETSNVIANKIYPSTEFTNVKDNNQETVLSSTIVEEPVTPLSKRRKLKKDDGIPISTALHESNLSEAEDHDLVFKNKEDETNDNSSTNESNSSSTDEDNSSSADESNSSSTDEDNSSSTDDGQSDLRTVVKKDDENNAQKILFGTIVEESITSLLPKGKELKQDDSISIRIAIPESDSDKAVGQGFKNENNLVKNKEENMQCSKVVEGQPNLFNEGLPTELKKANDDTNRQIIFSSTIVEEPVTHSSERRDIKKDDCSFICTIISESDSDESAKEVEYTNSEHDKKNCSLIDEGNNSSTNAGLLDLPTEVGTIVVKDSISTRIIAISDSDSDETENLVFKKKICKDKKNDRSSRDEGSGSSNNVRVKKDQRHIKCKILSVSSTVKKPLKKDVIIVISDSDSDEPLNLVFKKANNKGQKKNDRSSTDEGQPGLRTEVKKCDVANTKKIPSRTILENPYTHTRPDKSYRYYHNMSITISDSSDSDEALNLVFKNEDQNSGTKNEGGKNNSSSVDKDLPDCLTDSTIIEEAVTLPLNKGKLIKDDSISIDITNPKLDSNEAEKQGLENVNKNSPNSEENDQNDRSSIDGGVPDLSAAEVRKDDTVCKNEILFSTIVEKPVTSPPKREEPKKDDTVSISIITMTDSNKAEKQGLENLNNEENDKNDRSSTDGGIPDLSAAEIFFSTIVEKPDSESSQGEEKTHSASSNEGQLDLQTKINKDDDVNK